MSSIPNPHNHALPLVANVPGTIPDSYIKQLEAKALLEHYDEQQSIKREEDRRRIIQKMREMDEAKAQKERHLSEIERSRVIKEMRKNQYSQQYEQMIEVRKQREAAQKEQQIWLEKQLLERQSWIRDEEQQRQIEKTKKVDYAKEMERHLRMQEEKRLQQATRMREQRQKWKREAQEITSREDQQKVSKFRSRSIIQQRQNQILGVKDALNWTEGEGLGDDAKRQLLTPRMDRLLKLKEQQLYGLGLEKQYKSQNQKRYFERYSNPERLANERREVENGFNPITNPIRYTYKNPNILKLLQNYH